MRRRLAAQCAGVSRRNAPGQQQRGVTGLTFMDRINRAQRDLLLGGADEELQGVAPARPFDTLEAPTQALQQMGTSGINRLGQHRLVLLDGVQV
jgi:hypothetical protein